jgi:uncharacterized protein YraI
MRRNLFLAGFSLLFALILPSLASAASGYTTAGVNQRAGPGTGYPVVATVPANSPVQIYGCVQGGSWCDTLWAGNRGWIASAYLTAAWQGAPIIVYNQNVYYNSYYVGRPWYAQRRLYVGPNRKCYRGRFVVGCN